MISYVDCLGGEGAGPAMTSRCWNAGPDEELDELLPPRTSPLQPKTEGSLRRRLLRAKLHQNRHAIWRMNAGEVNSDRAGLPVGDNKPRPPPYQHSGSGPWYRCSQHLPSRPHIHPSSAPEARGKLFLPPDVQEKHPPQAPPLQLQHSTRPIISQHQTSPCYSSPGPSPLREPEPPPQFQYQPSRRRSRKSFSFRPWRNRKWRRFEQEATQTTPLLQRATAASGSDSSDSKWSVHYTTQKPQRLLFLPGKRRSGSAEDLRVCNGLTQHVDVGPSSSHLQQRRPASPPFTRGLDQSERGSSSSSTHRGWRDKSRKASSVSSDDEERFFVNSKRPLTPLVLNPVQLTTCWDVFSPADEPSVDIDVEPPSRLPTPEEKMRRQADAVPADIVPINITGESFDRQASFRRTLSNSDSSPWRSRNLSRRKTVTGVPEVSPRKMVSTDASSAGEFSAVGHPGPSSRSSTHQQKKLNEEKIEPPKEGRSSGRRIRAPKGEGMSSLMTSLTSLTSTQRGVESLACCPSDVNLLPKQATNSSLNSASGGDSTTHCQNLDLQHFHHDCLPPLPLVPSAKVLTQSISSASSLPSSPTPIMEPEWSSSNEKPLNQTYYHSSSPITNSESQFSYQALNEHSHHDLHCYSDGERWSYEPLSPSSSVHSGQTRCDWNDVADEMTCVITEGWSCEPLLSSGRSSPAYTDSISVCSEKTTSSTSPNRVKRKSSTSSSCSHRSISLRKSKRPPPLPLRSDSLQRRQGRSKVSSSSSTPRMERTTPTAASSSPMSFQDPWVPRTKRRQSGLNCGTVTTFEPLDLQTMSTPPSMYLPQAHILTPGSPGSEDEVLKFTHPPPTASSGLQRIASPSSGYSSQSNTPIPGTPLSSPLTPSSPLTAFPGDFSLPLTSPSSSTSTPARAVSSLPPMNSRTEKKSKPVVPQRKSSLLSYSSSSSLSSCTSSESSGKNPHLPPPPPPPPLPESISPSTVSYSPICASPLPYSSSPLPLSPGKLCAAPFSPPPPPPGPCLPAPPPSSDISSIVSHPPFCFSPVPPPPDDLYLALPSPPPLPNSYSPAAPPSPKSSSPLCLPLPPTPPQLLSFPPPPPPSPHALPNACPPKAPPVIEPSGDPTSPPLSLLHSRPPTPPTSPAKDPVVLPPTPPPLPPMSFPLAASPPSSAKSTAAPPLPLSFNPPPPPPPPLPPPSCPHPPPYSYAVKQSFHQAIIFKEPSVNFSSPSSNSSELPLPPPLPPALPPPNPLQNLKESPNCGINAASPIDPLVPNQALQDVELHALKNQEVDAIGNKLVMTNYSWYNCNQANSNQTGSNQALEEAQPDYSGMMVADLKTSADAKLKDPCEQHGVAEEISSEDPLYWTLSQFHGIVDIKQSHKPQNLRSPEKPALPKKPDLCILGIGSSPKAKAGLKVQRTSEQATVAPSGPSNQGLELQQTHGTLGAPSPTHQTYTTTDMSSTPSDITSSSPKRQKPPILHKKPDMSLSPTKSKLPFQSKKIGEDFRGTSDPRGSLEVMQSMGTTVIVEDCCISEALSTCSSTSIMGISPVWSPKSASLITLENTCVFGTLESFEKPNIVANSVSSVGSTQMGDTGPHYVQMSTIKSDLAFKGIVEVSTGTSGVCGSPVISNSTAETSSTETEEDIISGFVGICGNSRVTGISSVWKPDGSPHMIHGTMCTLENGGISGFLENSSTLVNLESQGGSTKMLRSSLAEDEGGDAMEGRQMIVSESSTKKNARKKRRRRVRRHLLMMSSTIEPSPSPSSSSSSSMSSSSGEEQDAAKDLTHPTESQLVTNDLETSDSEESCTLIGQSRFSLSSVLSTDSLQGEHSLPELLIQEPEEVEKQEKEVRRKPDADLLMSISAEQMFVPGQPRTTEDLFAIIHRSKRKMLGRRDSEEDRHGVSSFSSSSSCSSEPALHPLLSTSRSQKCLRSDSFKALLLRKGSRSDLSSRISAVERLCKPASPPGDGTSNHQGAPSLPQQPHKTPVESSSSSHPAVKHDPVLNVPLSTTSPNCSMVWRKKDLRHSLFFNSSSSTPFIFLSSSSSMRPRSLTPPCSSSRRYAARSRLFAAPMTAIFEGEEEDEDEEISVVSAESEAVFRERLVDTF